MSNERAPNCQRMRNKTVTFMTNETINRRVEKRSDLEEKIAELENCDSLSDRQTERLDALNERLDALEQLIDALNVDLVDYCL